MKLRALLVRYLRRCTQHVLACNFQTSMLWRVIFGHGGHLRWLAWMKRWWWGLRRYLEDILGNFAANEWIRRPDTLIFRDFSANEWIRRPDIRIFRHFATGRATWYWSSICAPDPYSRIFVFTDIIWGYLSDIWFRNIGYFQPWRILNHRIFANL